MRRLLERRKTLVIMVTLLALGFVAFEIIVRALPPDAVQYTIQTINPVGPDSTVSGSITDPKIVARWRAAMTEKPSGFLIQGYTGRWLGVGCSAAGGSYTTATYRFTWHGLPVEAVSPGPPCSGGYQVSSGGIPDLRTYIINFPLPNQP